MKINKAIKKILSVALCFALVLSCAPIVGFDITAKAADDITVTIASGESVTLKDTDADYYYEISNANELYAFATIVNGGNNTINAELTADIDLNPGYTFNANGTVTYNDQTVTEGFASWTPVGSANNSYAGTFDGADLTISGLYYNGTDVYSGMFAYMSGVVKNLNLTNTYVKSQVTTSGSKDISHTAGIAAYSSGEINNCSYSGAIVNTTYYVAYAGGIVAENKGLVFDCVNYGSLNIKTTNQSAYVGGVVGRQTTEDDIIRISCCYNEGTITAISETYGYSGGIIGYITGGILSDCYNIGDASIDSDAGGGYSGGIVGFINRDTLVTRSTNKDSNIVAVSSAYAYGGGIAGQSYGNISDCYSIGGTITSDAYYYRAHSSGVVGFVDEGSVEGCYAIDTSLKITGGKTKLIGGVVSYITPAVTLKDNWYCTDDASYGVAFMYKTEQSNFEVEGGTAGMPRESFTNGEIAYLLGEPFGQNLDNGEAVQDYPVLDGAKVYCGYKACGAATVSYSNYPLYETIPDHSLENGFCTICGLCEEPQTIEGVYQLANAGNLFWFAKRVNENEPSANAVLIADIDLENREWTPIGNATTPYTGLFDGQNYKIANFKMTINEPSNSNGFFGEIRNTTVKNFSISGDVAVNIADDTSSVRFGSVAAAALSTDADVCIQNIHSSVNVTFNGGYSHQVGGIVGYAEGKSSNPWYKALVEDCSYSGTIDLGNHHADCAGGMVAYIGYNNYAKIMGCKFDGAILCASETGGQIGGIFGYNRGRNMYMQNCLSIGEIEVANPKTTGALAGRYLVTTEDSFFTTPHAYNNYYNVGELPGFANVTDENHGYYNIDIVDYPGYEEYKDTIDIKVTEEQLALGEIAYKLGGSWGQLIGADETPVIGGTKVFCGYTACSDTTVTYSNTELFETIPEHNPDANGFCTACGAYEEPQTVDGVYQIANAGNLLWFSDYVNNGNYDANAELLADIEMNSIIWSPIATTQGYMGTFDGKGHSINNLWHNTGVGNGNRDGLFIRVGSEGKVVNLTLNNPTIWGASHSGSNAVGGIANLNAGTISGCVIIGGEIQQGNYEYLGGIAGCNQSGGLIENCAVINVTFQRRWGGASSGTMGGITQTNNGTVRNCYTYGCNFANGTAQNSAIVAKGTAGESCYYYTTDTVADTASAPLTAEQFASGEAAWLLNGASADGQWKQTLDTDAYPVLAGATVYLVNDCQGNQHYMNENETLLHDFTGATNGICILCDKGYQKPEGEGTEESPYKITNAGELYWFARCVNIGKQASANAILMADIDLEGRVWYPIGLYNDVAEENGGLVMQSYKGTFDGNGHTISNFVASGSGSQGLIGYTTTDVTVKNLGVINATVSGWNAGAILAFYGTVENCYAINCTITAYTSSTSSVGVYGGAVAGAQAATVKNSFAMDCTVVAGEGMSDKAELAPVGGNTAENCYYSNVTANNGTLRESAGEMNATTAQLASGEVAWLLQSGNTEQVWGQQNNQIGARPVFDFMGLYKVAKIDGTENYSVSNIGDTNGDNLIDVLDYQALINEILADDNEQIEAEGYDDIIKYDLDGDGYLDVIDATLMQRVINGNATIDVYAVGDIDCNGIAFEESDLGAIKHLLNSGKKLSTTQKYICDINKDGKASVVDLIVLEDIYGDIEESCGNVIDATYSWSEDFTSCTATGKCEICGSEVTETSYSLSVNNGITTAAFENEGFVSPKLIDVAAGLSYYETRKAVTSYLKSGDMNLNLVLTAEIDDTMVDSIRGGIESANVPNGSINLTLYGLEIVPYDSFGTKIEYYIDFEEEYPLDQLKTVSLPDATTIEVSAFNGNNGIESVYAPNVTNIQGVAFWGCKSLAEIYCPNVQVIGQQAFDSCTALTELYFPEVTSVDSYAFSDCTALEKVYLPKLTTVSYGVFYGSESLNSLTFGSLKSAYALFKSGFTGSTNIDLTLGVGQKVFENTSGYRWDATDEDLQPGATEFMGATFKSITIAEA